MKFKSRVRRIYKPGTGVDVTFEDGVYVTDDPAEVAVLKKHPLVEVDEAVEEEVVEDDPLPDFGSAPKIDNPFERSWLP